MAEIIHPQGWPAAKGYSNGMAAEGKVIFVGGQIGWTKDQTFETDDFVGQAEQAMRNIVDVLESAGAETTDLVRLTWFITDKKVYVAEQKRLGEAYRRVFGRHYPAMTLVQVVALLEDRALVEIEATAVIPAR
ncbi:RidA family protein [Phyllobacterium myrsinacearum]|uniref:Enamine deaminase RidA n=1 Tax=Phyllobacterium myrsinacearum TaxID=28101 RepID=A0A2S9JF66_9HYPH|nr:RidA family protein [Phyllobacterium myrsinacearum]PRD51567.1 enamine deaminase RidA [Phyllobacterium myrsinacearum]PWV89576.1 enamine deaminase RidA (YjgF/YER057c/UK114 family) [Phyllobacterium myrsinacearum]RZS79156.1 enamine deaminase RidA (YjgF/YER057c/UK114 family) [Phyllobacterium myrsinacearum]RZU99833.1 enamine deaminase RidA (YjgF/YER057c/UK114 family) [Phyllobacterium myrsinacearum]